MWPALVKQGTSCKRQAADFIFSTNQHCRVFMVSDNHLDQYLKSVIKDMLLEEESHVASDWMHLKGMGHKIDTV